MCPTFDSNLAARNHNLIIFLVLGILMDEQATFFLSWLLNLFLFFFCADVLKLHGGVVLFLQFDITCFESVSFFNPKRLLLRVWNLFPFAGLLYVYLTKKNCLTLAIYLPDSKE